MRIVGRLVGPEDLEVPRGSDEELIEQAHETRLEMQILNRQLAAAGKIVQVERGGWYPSVSASAQYFRQDAPFPSEDDLSLSLLLHVPVFDGGRTRARVAAAKEDQRQIELLEQTVRREIADQVDTALLTYRAAGAALEAARERVAAAREAYHQVDRAYRVGEASAVDLLDATTEATDAETSHIIARSTYEFQALALRHAVGQPPLPDLADPQPQPDPGE